MTAGFVVLLPLFLALLAAPAAVVAGALRPAYSALVGSAFAALAAGAVLWGWFSGGGVVDVAWIPSWGVRFAVALDGFAALYALLATGIGFAVLLYSSRYLPLHLEHEGRPESDAAGFYFFVLLFMGSMVGLAMARDLILLFDFWDLTTIASYYLIGYDRHKEASRASAQPRGAALALVALDFGGSALSFLYAFQVYQRRYMRPDPEVPGKPSPRAARLLVVALAALVIALGLWPEPLIYLSERAAAVLTGGQG